MPWSESDVRVGEGVRLHVYRRGAGRPIVLAHGATDSGPCWERFARALEDDYEVIAYDARYHGKSDAPEDGQFGGGDDLLGIVESLGLERPALLGHSMGANTVAQAAAAAPGRFRCAILEDPPWWAEPPTARRGPAMDFSGLTVEQIAAEGRTQSPLWDESEFPAWAESKKQFRPPPDWMAGFGRRLGQWREVVARMDLPTLLITGGSEERGRIVTPEVADEASKLAPDLRHVTLAAAGHNVRREAFNEYVTAVRGFLAEVENGGR